MKTIDILIAAKALISKPNGFGKFESARTKAGIVVGPRHPEACRFCTFGAIERASGYSFHDLQEATFSMIDVMQDITDFNDNHTKKEVLNKFDEAIANESEKEN